MFGLGIELETGIYYNYNEKIHSIDVEKLIKINNSSLLEEEKKLLKSLPLLEEPSNKCLVKIKNKQIELVTKFPLDKKIEEAIFELEIDLKRFLVIFQKLFNYRHKREDILLFYPKLSCMKYQDIDNKEVFSNTGSIHINISFPHYGKSQLNKYKRFIVLFQSLEPILTALTSSGDYRYNTDGYPKSGYRSVIGWGSPGTSDKNLLKYGLGKSATFKPQYIEKLNKYKLTTLDKKECQSKRMKIERYYYNKFNIKTPAVNYSSDIATIKKEYYLNFIKYFSENMYEKFSIRTYKEGFGLEIRFFDRMETKNIREIVYFLVLLGDFAFNCTHKLIDAKINKDWNEEILNVFENGHKSKLSDKYIELLEKNFDMKIKNNNSETIIKEIINMLYNNYGKGDFIKLMSNEKNIRKPKIYNMNKFFLNAYK